MIATIAAARLADGHQRANPSAMALPLAECGHVLAPKRNATARKVTAVPYTAAMAANQRGTVVCRSARELMPLCGFLRDEAMGPPCPTLLKNG